MTDEEEDVLDEDEDIEAAAELYSRMEREDVPYREEIRAVVSKLNEMISDMSSIVRSWQSQHLKQADARDPNNHVGQNFENYSSPIITPVEMIRKVGFRGLAFRLYNYIVTTVDNHCLTTGKIFTAERCTPILESVTSNAVSTKSGFPGSWQPQTKTSVSIVLQT